jgi:hypothetical protein
MEAMTERMGYHVVGHHSPMPGAGKIAQALVATCRLEDSLHASIITIVPYSCKTGIPRRLMWMVAALMVVRGVPRRPCIW